MMGFVKRAMAVGVLLWLYGDTAQAQQDWPMAAANPARTSHCDTEVAGGLKVQWYKPIEPYISQKVQLIAAADMIFVSTARGLYVLDAASGDELWVFPTEMPLGHSPTYSDGTLYVGGHDRRLYAVDATNGSLKWSFDAESGFQVNPLVIDGSVFAGNRDGNFYALDAANGNERWRFKTDGPILFSAAYDNGLLFFASQDSHAYAIRANNGELVWKKKLASGGFHSYWPVVYRDRVVFVTAHNYLTSGGDPGSEIASLSQADSAALFPDRNSTDPPAPPRGTPISTIGQATGSWVTGTPTYDASSVVNYHDSNPSRRTVYVLDLITGEEKEPAPYLWAWTRSGTRHPPVVGYDDVLYLTTNYLFDPAINGGHVSGWEPGSNVMSVISSDWAAVDEPHAISAGGKYIYWNLCCNRQGGTIDISKPNTDFYNNAQQAGDPTSLPDPSREWFHINYNLDELAPGYNDAYAFNATEKPYAAFGGPNGSYGYHGDVNALIPYKGRLYTHRGNSVFAFSADGSAKLLSQAMIQPSVAAPPAYHNADILREKLASEINKMLEKGHLRPGYKGHGIWSLRAESVCGERLNSYFHHPAETLATLAWALPYLDADLAEQTKQYMRMEYESYPPQSTNDVGWSTGAAREAFELPPEVQADLPSLPASASFFNFEGWQRNPYAFYGLWKYAEAIQKEQSIYASLTDLPEAPPSDDYLKRNPHVLNAYIAGYIGYTELQKAAGVQEDASLASERDRLIKLRIDSFTVDSGYKDANTVQEYYCRTLNTSNNFIFLVPELALRLRDTAYSRVEAAILAYSISAPYWFVSFTEEGYAENAISPLQDTTMLMARTWIMRESVDKLDRYLDVPGFAVGDLYYIQKLVALLWAYEFGPAPAPITSSTNTNVIGGCGCELRESFRGSSWLKYFGMVVFVVFLWRRKNTL
ncbi:MAG: PQQ-like beta-propeller repeat protein [Myxococcales bacterium]|nr:MAG: PQQ-like beta-propeller repeat protein [Myxococcales bacterium]